MNTSSKTYGRIAIVLITLAALLFLGLRYRQAVSAQKVDLTPAAAATDQAPDFPAGLDWLNTDHPVTLTELRGKIVLLDFWTYCCINCIHVIPDLKKLEAQFPNELVVIGVHSAKFAAEKGTDNIRQAVLRYDLEHPVVNDGDFQIWNAYGASGWPTFVLIDPQGHVVASRSGEGVYDAFESVIAKLVKQSERQGMLDRKPIHWSLERDRRPMTLLSFPGKIAADAAKNILWVTDSNHHRVVALSPTGEVMQVIGGGQAGLIDGSLAEARFNKPQGLAVAGDKIYVADTENHAIRMIDLTVKQVTTLAGTGEQAERGWGWTGAKIALNSPWDLTVVGDKLYLAMAGPHQLWELNLTSGAARPWAGTGIEDINDGPLATADLAQPSGITFDGRDTLYFADSEVSAVRRTDLGPDGVVGTLVGRGLFRFGDKDGPIGEALLQHPLGVAWHDGAVYVADTYNNKVKRLDPAKGTIETLLGTGREGMTDGPPREAQFNEPNGLAFLGEKLYVADTNNHLIRVYDPTANTVGTLNVNDPRNLLGMAPVVTGATTRPASPLRRATPIELPAQDVTAGEGELVLNLILPDGYKINGAAPFYIGVRSQDAAVAMPDEAWIARNIPDVTFPLRVPVTLRPGQTTITADLVVYYCEAVKESLCLVKPLQVTIPLRVSNDGASAGRPVIDATVDLGVTPKVIR
ncbi:MAG: redoxin domain-containing protein [Phycisphaeraceae bacterium]|nr:redoxin domain-containing protein [Phycisphaeraceae bacterium]